MSSCIIALLKRHPTPLLNPLREHEVSRHWWHRWLFLNQIYLLVKKARRGSDISHSRIVQSSIMDWTDLGCFWKQQISEWICFTSILRQVSGGEEKKNTHNILYFPQLLEVLILKGNAFTLNRLLGRTSWWCKWGPSKWNYPSHGAFQKKKKKDHMAPKILGTAPDDTTLIFDYQIIIASILKLAGLIKPLQTPVYVCVWPFCSLSFKLHKNSVWFCIVTTHLLPLTAHFPPRIIMIVAFCCIVSP